MIDIHSHIIPGIDDGSKNVEETFDMIYEAEKSGFTDIIFTPHYLTHYYEPTPGEIVLWKKKLQKILNSNNTNIKLHSGMEIYISNSIEELVKKNSILTLAESRYILIELPLACSVNYIDNVLYYLRSMSMQVILAHPERYKSVQENPDLVYDYIEKGALIQCNYGSILGFYGEEAKKTMKKLLKKGTVSFLGSDCHKPETVYKYMTHAVKKIKNIVGEKEFEKISTENPRKVLNNEEWEWE